MAEPEKYVFERLKSIKTNEYKNGLSTIYKSLQRKYSLRRELYY